MLNKVNKDYFINILDMDDDIHYFIFSVLKVFFSDIIFIVFLFFFILKSDWLEGCSRIKKCWSRNMYLV